jgi:hypothetical protein
LGRWKRSFRAVWDSRKITGLLTTTSSTADT